MKKLILCLLLCALTLTAGVGTYAARLYDGEDAPESGEDTGDSGNTTPPVELTPLEAPAVAGWGRDYRFLLNRVGGDTGDSEEPLYDEGEEQPEPETPYADFPGMMYWSVNEDGQNHYRLDVYKRDQEEGNQLVDSAEEWTTSETGGYASSFRFLWDVRGSGDYYFTVRAVGDGLRYGDSETTQSDVWNYEAPDDQLTQPPRPLWKQTSKSDTVFITPPDNDVDESGNPTVDGLYRVGYQARWWYVQELKSGTTPSFDDEDAEAAYKLRTTPRNVGEVLTFYPTHLEFQPTDKILAENGAGYYSVQVRVLSSDITKAKVSLWSELSMARYIVPENPDLEAIVNRIDENSDAFNRQLALNNVRAFGTETLRELMALDLNNTGAAGSIVRLESILGCAANVVVSGGLEDVFPASTLSVIGAGLNVDLGQSVTFHLGPAHSDEVLPSLYDHAVRFSMQLLDADGNSLTESVGELAVPVKITLPIPSTINPRFFVLLHHRTDGVVETITHPALRSVNDQWYATFLLTHFSDFTMAEQVAYLAAAPAADGVSVSYRFRADGVRYACCALRDAAGRLLNVTPLEPSETTATVTIPCPAAYSVRLFLFDAASRPATTALETRVEGGPPQ